MCKFRHILGSSHADYSRRSTSMALGRPSMISHQAHQAVPLPYVATEHHATDPAPRTCIFFNYNMKLFFILGDILDRIYDSRRGNKTEPNHRDNLNLQNFHDIEGIESSLSLFQSNLPFPLQWKESHRNSNGPPTQLPRESNILHARLATSITFPFLQTKHIIDTFI